MLAERVRLAHPIRVGGRVIESVTVRRPNGADRAMLGEALLVVASNLRDLEDIRRARQIIACHLTDLGLAALTIEDHEALEPISGAVLAFMAEETN